MLDASMLLAAVMPDEPNPSKSVVNILDACEDVRVPPLWFSEVGNAVTTAASKRRITDADASRLLDKVQQLNVTIDHKPPNLSRIFDLARQFKLSAYHATYLELAKRTGCALLTMDVSLSEAAKKCGVKVLR